MYAKWGYYRHALDEVAFTTQKTPITAGGLQIGVEEIWNLTGFIQAATQSALMTALVLLEAAYGRNQQDAVILLNDGVTVFRRLPGVHPLGGTEVVSGVSYPNDGQGANGAEAVSHRTFAVTVKGRYGTQPDNNVLLRFDEAISFSGGGPLTVHKESKTSPPQKQLLKRFTTFRATQQGSAVGLLIWPTPPLPVWPAAEVIPQRQIAHKSPKRNGSSGQPAYTEYEVTWAYTFESATPLSGRPRYWR